MKQSQGVKSHLLVGGYKTETQINEKVRLLQEENGRLKAEVMMSGTG